MARSNGGYTLVEVTLALLVMSVGLVSVLSVFPVALRWAGQTNANVMAASAARSLMEDLRNEYSATGGTAFGDSGTAGTTGVYVEAYGFWMDPVLLTGAALPWTTNGDLDLKPPPDSGDWQLQTIRVHVYLIDPGRPEYQEDYHRLGAFTGQVYLGTAKP